MNTIKDQLYEIRELDKTIDCKIAQVKHLKEQAECLQSMDFSQDRIQGGKAKDPMKVMDRAIDLSRDITEDIDRLVNMKQAWRQRLFELSPNQRNVLELYYFDRKTFEEVAVKLHLEYRWVRRLHKRGLCNLEKLTPHDPLKI